MISIQFLPASKSEYHCTISVCALYRHSGAMSGWLKIAPSALIDINVKLFFFKLQASQCNLYGFRGCSP